MNSYLIDGYNLINAIPELTAESLQSLRRSRSALVSLCKTALAQKKSIDRITIVFDSDRGRARLF